MTSFSLAWQFLTVLPAPGRGKADARLLARALAFFPVVGALLGGIVAAADALWHGIFAPTVASTLTLALLVALTGALHLDGLADTCDGLWAPGRDREARLAIMRDSHLGAYGVVGLVLLLLLKLGALGALPAPERWSALIIAPVIGRWAIVYSMASQPYARGASGATAALKAGATPRVLVASTVWMLLVCLIMGPAGPLVAAACVAAAFGLTRLIASRLGGMTGDTCGAACEVTETLALLLAPIAARTVESLAW